MILYVDDLIITGNEASMIEGLKEDLKRSFEMSDLGLLHLLSRSRSMAKTWPDIHVAGQIFLGDSEEV